MKKGIIISLVAMVLVALVGCGIANKLEGTKWELDLLGSAKTVYSFESGNVLKMTSTVGSFDPTVTEGTWECSGNDLTLAYDGTTVTYVVDIDGDTMYWGTELIRDVFTLTRVK